MQKRINISSGAIWEDKVVRDISQWEEAGRAHAEFFSIIKPATSMIEVSRLINPDLLIEIEVSAVVQGHSN